MHSAHSRESGNPEPFIIAGSPLPRGGADDSNKLGSVTQLAERSAAITRTSRGCTSGMRASRVQGASKYGHAFSPHSVPSGRMSARSPLAPTIGALAPTCGDKLAKATNIDAGIAVTSMAQALLIMSALPVEEPRYWKDVLSGRVYLE